MLSTLILKGSLVNLNSQFSELIYRGNRLRFGFSEIPNTQILRSFISGLLKDIEYHRGGRLILERKAPNSAPNSEGGVAKEPSSQLNSKWWHSS